MDISKLTQRQKKIAIGVGISVIAITFLLYNRNKNKKDADAILDYISKMPSQVDLSSATDSGMALVRGTKIDLSKMKIDNMSGAYKNRAIRNAIAKIVTDLYSSMKGANTDVKAFANTLARIKNKNTLAFVDMVYKSSFKEGLFEAMKGEFALNNVYYVMFSDKTKYNLAIPFLTDAKWAPQLSAYFNNLPMY